MKLFLEQGEYIDMKPCCDSSLFEMGASIPDTAKDDWCLNDFGYFGGFAIQWKFVNGQEGPMAVYKYDQLWLGTSGTLLKLPSGKNERFMDGVTHYPASHDAKSFIATTTEHHRGKWIGHLLVYRLAETWELAHRITHSDYMRPIQFIDDNRFLVMKSDGLNSLDLSDGCMTPLVKIDNGIYSNAHLTSDRQSVAAVRAADHESEPTGIDLYHIGTQTTKQLSFGLNTITESELSWLDEVSVPIRVGNGMVSLNMSRRTT